MSLRNQLEAKPRRRASVDVQVSDPGDDLRRRAAAAERDLFVATALAAEGKADGITESTVKALREAAEPVLAELAGHYATVELQAASAVEWDAILTEHTTDTDDLADAALADMLALCAVDEDLRDADWWAQQLASPLWTFGERESLRQAVLNLNAYRPRPSLGKG